MYSNIEVAMGLCANKRGLHSRELYKEIDSLIIMLGILLVISYECLFNTVLLSVVYFSCHTYTNNLTVICGFKAWSVHDILSAVYFLC